MDQNAGAPPLVAHSVHSCSYWSNTWKAREPGHFLSVMDTGHQITRLLQELRAGDASALDRLLPLVYDELRQIAHRQRRVQPGSGTIDTTALVHEAYLKLVGHSAGDSASRAHFFAIAARAMRQILIDQARKHGTLKRGGMWKRVTLDDGVAAVEQQADLLLALDDALARLAQFNERLSRIVECRFFGGLTEQETATALDLSERTVRRDWLKARLWLYGELVEENTH
jgi:RNA polymerase sigma factor (TIGR02999 family)